MSDRSSTGRSGWQQEPFFYTRWARDSHFQSVWCVSASVLVRWHILTVVTTRMEGTDWLNWLTIAAMAECACPKESAQKEKQLITQMETTTCRHRSRTERTTALHYWLVWRVDMANGWFYGGAVLERQLSGWWNDGRTADEEFEGDLLNDICRA